METLRSLASRRPLVEEDEEAPQEHHHSPRVAQGSEHTDPQPLAAAGEGAERQTRVDRLEAD